MDKIPDKFCIICGRKLTENDVLPLCKEHEIHRHEINKIIDDKLRDIHKQARNLYGFYKEEIM